MVSARHRRYTVTMLLPSAAEPVAIIGAGPAGLTAAYELARRGAPAVVLEADDVVGGLSRTAVRNGWRFDIGGHRFFTKVAAVEALWHELLPGDDFLLRPRKSRIYYRGRFFDYPLRPVNALLNLGPLEALLCLLSYLSVRLRPPRDQSSFEGWTAARFGWRLYRIFFKSYTEKVWGAPCTAIQADWAAQRIKNLSLGSALWSALVPSARGNSITSLIEEFRYPKFGPGMMWERCHERVEAAGVPVHLHSPVVRVCHEAGRARAVVFARQGGEERLPVSQVISSMPIGQLLRAMDPPPPATVLEAAARLKYRDFVVVALVVPKSCAFPDNWIYIHAPEVRLGRVQNFGAWSPHMVHSGRTCLGLEYFVHADDELWTMPDAELIELAKREIASIGLLDPAAVEEGYVVRMPKAYPVYDSEYQRHVATLREWLAVFAPNVQTVGRNGMHRYNNQDHSMYTAMLAVENIFGTSHDLWRVNVEEAYLEEVALDGDGSGRAAPVLPG